MILLYDFREITLKVHGVSQINIKFYSDIIFELF